MKQNIIIILLTAAVILLLVNLLLGRVPPLVYGAKAGNNWVICPRQSCIAIDSAGVAYLVLPFGGTKIGRISSFKTSAEKKAEEAEATTRTQPTKAQAECLRRVEQEGDDLKKRFLCFGVQIGE